MFINMHTLCLKLGDFQNFQNSAVGHFITWLIKKLQKRSLQEVIDDTLPFIFNLKGPLRDNMLLTYKQGC